MKVSPKTIETPRNNRTSSQSSLNRKFRNDSGRFREPVVHKTDVPVLSDSLLRRIDHARHLNNQNSQIQNLPLLPILKSYESRRVLSSSKSARQNLGSARQLNSASRYRGTMTPNTAKKLPKSTKISAFNNSNLSGTGSKHPEQASSLSQSSNTSVNSSNDNQHNHHQQINHQHNYQQQNQHQKESTQKDHGLVIDDKFQTGVFNFKEKYNDHSKVYQSNQFMNSNQSQSSLLRSLRNDTENSSMAEIIVRPTPIKPNKYDEGINKKLNNNNPNITLAPLIKNFRLNSFDFHGEFNLEKHSKNTQILKPLSDFNLKSNNKLTNKNYELAMNGSGHKPQIINSNKSINYLAAGILSSKKALNFNGSSHASLSRKLDLEDFEYYDVHELFKKNNQLKSGLFRKKLSQINEESTIDGTPLTNSRWSSSMSNVSGHTIKFNDSEEVVDDIWSDIDENTNLPSMKSSARKQNDMPVPLAIPN